MSSAVGVVVVMAVVVVVVVTAVVAVVAVSPGMILCFQKVRFSWFLKRRHGPTYLSTDLPTNGQTDPLILIEMRGRI